MKKPNKHIPPTGELRLSHLITTFGPGAMVDLPDHSVLIGGLETWQWKNTPIQSIHEPRLAAALAEYLKTDREISLRYPPTHDSEQEGAGKGVAVFQFPSWFLAQVDLQYTSPDGRVYRTRPLLRYNQLVRGRYLDARRKRHEVVPVRFVQACVRGHISDIDWYRFVRPNSDDITGQLWLDEGGAGNDFSEIYVRDEKYGSRRPLSEATLFKNKVLGSCNGKTPWLGPGSRRACKEPARLLTRAASNAYFAQTLSVISIPDPGEATQEQISAVWEEFLQYCEDAEDVRHERKKPRVRAALEGLSDPEVWAAIEARRHPAQAPALGIKEAELRTLLTQAESLGEDVPEGDFFARQEPLPTLPPAIEGKLSQLVSVHRLREVVAQLGFTRFEPSLPTVGGDLELEVELAPIAEEPSWLPAYENRGEGLLLSFSKAAIDAWLKRPGVERRGAQLLRGHKQREELRGREIPFPGLHYIMLHTLSHLLITTMALDSGYSASSIRERIYVEPELGYAILLYTGSPGAEGTLGGLVRLGKQIGRHLERALEYGRLCSNDPVCAQHAPDKQQEARFTHGAACHGCLLIAETSCERFNTYLDRALVVPTLDTAEAAFFAEPT